MAENNNAIELSPEKLGERLKKARNDAHMLQKELGQAVGVTQVTVLNWEKGTSVPDCRLLIRICRALNIKVSYLLGDISPAILGIEADMTEKEQALLKGYRELPPKQQRIADTIISAMKYEEKGIPAVLVKEEEIKPRAVTKDSHSYYTKKRAKMLLQSYMTMELQSTAAAAGLGDMFGDTEPETVFVKVTSVNRRADTIVMVDGHSMEPDYPDGCNVYVQYTQAVDVGEDVIASSADGAVIKRVGTDGKTGERILYSVNPSIPFPKHYDDDNVRIIGRVLGIVQDNEMADEKDIPELQELFDTKGN